MATQSSYTAWYRNGTVTVTKSSKSVAGVNTYWTSAGLNPGDMFTLDNSTFYEIDSVVDSSHINLKTAYTGATQKGVAYSIVRLFSASTGARIASVGAQLLGYFDTYIDNDMQSIHGKSAYEVAVQNGYTGTQAQWLESLKAAGEWSNASSRLSALETSDSDHTQKIDSNKAAISTLTQTTSDHTTAISTLTTTTSTNATNIATLTKRTEPMTYTNTGAKNSLYRGKNLGSVVTDEQWATIAARKFDDLYVGDYWKINGHTYRIAHFGGLYIPGDSASLTILSDELYEAQWHNNNTDDTGYVNSDIFQTLTQAEEIVETAFGANHIYNKITQHVANNAHGSGNSTRFEKLKVVIPNMYELYGYPGPKYVYPHLAYNRIQFAVCFFNPQIAAGTHDKTAWVRDSYVNYDEEGNIKGVKQYVTSNGWEVKNRTETFGVRVWFILK